MPGPDAFSFSRRPSRRMWPDVAKCDRVRPGVPDGGRHFPDGLQCATTNRVSACAMPKTGHAFQAMAYRGGSLNRACSTAARHDGRGGKAWRPYPLPFAAQRSRLRRVVLDCCSGNPEKTPAWTRCRGFGHGARAGNARFVVLSAISLEHFTFEKV